MFELNHARKGGVLTEANDQQFAPSSLRCAANRQLPVVPFVVKWDWPLFLRAQELDSSKLKQVGGRPASHSPEDVLKCLGDQRLTAPEWKRIANDERGISKTRFYEFIGRLEEAQKVAKSPIDRKWEQIRKKSRNYGNDKDQ